MIHNKEAQSRLYLDCFHWLFDPLDSILGMTFEFRYCPLTSWSCGSRGLGLTLYISMTIHDGLDRNGGVDIPMQIYPIQPRDLQVMHMLSVLSAPSSIVRGTYTKIIGSHISTSQACFYLSAHMLWRKGGHTHSFHSLLNALLQDERLARMDNIDNSRCPDRLQILQKHSSVSSICYPSVMFLL